MACFHKFKNHLTINYAKNWNPETLIVGTFNPEWTDNNSAEWFYGRTENNYFWNVLPQLYNHNCLLSGSINDWMEFCETKKIAITDLIECINSANYDEHKKIISGFSDKAIENNFSNDNDLTVVNILDILNENPTIKNVYFTRGASQGLWKRLWQPIKQYCIKNNIHCEELLTPSGFAFYQYNKEQKLKYDTLQSFILSRWKDKWHNI